MRQVSVQLAERLARVPFSGIRKVFERAEALERLRRFCAGGGEG